MLSASTGRERSSLRHGRHVFEAVWLEPMTREDQHGEVVA